MYFQPETTEIPIAIMEQGQDGAILQVAISKVKMLLQPLMLRAPISLLAQAVEDRHTMDVLSQTSQHSERMYSLVSLLTITDLLLELPWRVQELQE